jgi:hypothetical protein
LATIDVMQYLRFMAATVLTGALVMVAATGCDDDTCEWDGETYERGETFPAGDGCNSCHCGDDGQVSCTLVACLDAGT